MQAVRAPKWETTDVTGPRRPAVRGSQLTSPEDRSGVRSTRQRIITATIDTLREEGFAGTSARSIARHGSFNQALIFYHFGSVFDVLISAVERVSADRLAQYRSAVVDVSDLRTALTVAREQYATDVREGHITVLAELLAGASSLPELGPEMVRCMEPWISFAEESISRFLAGTPLQSLIPVREAAHALLAIYLGMELLDHLDPDADTAAPLFLVAERMLAAIEPFLGLAAKTGDRSSRRPVRVLIDGPPSGETAEGRPRSRKRRSAK
jgi:AcrR family transcriptional regulator